MPRRLTVLSLCAMVGAALAAPAAQASKPYITHYKDLPATYTDDTLCSFPVQVNGSDHVTIKETDNQTVFVDKFRGTVTGPTGKQLTKSEDAKITDDNATGNETWNGVAEAYGPIGGGQDIARDTGEIVFDQFGNTVSEKGPHPIADGPGRDAVCAALAP
jgi:hypothetical protein